MEVANTGLKLLPTAEREQGEGQLKEAMWCAIKLWPVKKTERKKEESLLMKLMSQLETPLQSILISPQLFTKESSGSY